MTDEKRVQEDEIRHRNGCPSERTETFDHQGPMRDPNERNRIVGTTYFRISRCNDCGAQITKKVAERRF